MNNAAEALKTVLGSIYCNDADFPCDECPYGRNGGCNDPHHSLEDAIRLLRNRYNI